MFNLTIYKWGMYSNDISNMNMSSSNLLRSIFSFLFFSVFFTLTDASVTLPAGENITAVMVSGDSIVDTGNNNYTVTPTKCNFHPCDNDFYDGKSTGRFSNWKIPSDLIASENVSQDGTFPALLAFGDSILDTGNNNLLLSLTKCNYPPYGRDLNGGIPTGRFGNGRVMSDLIADGLGIKPLVPAYRDPKLQNNDLLTGVSFASGGSGLDKITAGIQGVIWVPNQVNDFKEYIGKLNGAAGDPAKANSIISNAVYVISAGNNDLAITYFSTAFRIFQYDVGTYTDKLISWTDSFLKSLYDLGARKFAVFGTLPLGCLPGARAVVGWLICFEPLNQAAEMFNGKLSALLQTLTTSFPDAKFAYVDMYSPLLEFVKHPQNSGFVVVHDGCCCTFTHPIPCLDDTRYVFWDYGHPTQKSYELIVSQLIGDLEAKLV